MDKDTINSYLLELKETEMKRLDHKALQENLSYEQRTPFYKTTNSKRLTIKKI